MGQFSEGLARLVKGTSVHHNIIRIISGITHPTYNKDLCNAKSHL